MWGRGAVLGLAAAAATLTVVAPAPAAADEACDTRVFEEAARLGQYRQSVDQLATTLHNAYGADVYVRVLGTVPDADLDRWQADMQGRCPNWRDAEGERADKLLVVAVAADDRKTGIYYGEYWANALDSNWRRIQETSMNPHFKRGDFGLGVVSGLAGVINTIGQAGGGSQPVRQTSPTTVFRDRTDRDFEPPTGFESEHDDDNSFGGFVGVMFGLGLLAMVVRAATGRGLGTPDTERRWGSSFGSSSFDSSSSGSSGSSSGGSSGGGGSGGGGGGSTSW